MTTSKRLVEMILNSKNDQFRTVLNEELRERTAIIMEKMYKNQTKKLLETATKFTTIISSVKLQENLQNIKSVYIDKTYQLKDGGLGVLSEQDREMVSKLYKNLNNDNKERMVKLLSESQETFNRVLNLARLENKKQGTKNG